MRIFLTFILFLQNYSFNNSGRTENRFKKINNVPGNRKGPGAPEASSSSTSKALNEMYRVTIPQGHKHERDHIIQKIRSGVGEDFPYYNVSFFLYFDSLF